MIAKLPWSEKPTLVDALEPEKLPPGLHRLRIRMGHDALGTPITVPVIVLKSPEQGPVVGVTAAVHGNELNGIPVIHHLLRSEAVGRLLRGTLVAAPVVNGAGFLMNQREFHDGQDLNRIMPGKDAGNCGVLFAHRFVERVLPCFEYLLDLHTASFGRVNTFYIRANMTKPVVARLARLVRPTIIVHNGSGDGTLRRTATERGIHALTIEVGNPQRLQPGLVRSSRLGIQEVLEHLAMIPDLEDPTNDEALECSGSYWIYTDEGGLLHVLPDLAETVEAGQIVARLTDVWGDTIREYRAPESGVVIGKSSNPVAFPGSRILHLGIPGAVDLKTS